METGWSDLLRRVRWGNVAPFAVILVAGAVLLLTPRATPEPATRITANGATLPQRTRRRRSFQPVSMLPEGLGSPKLAPARRARC